MGRKKTPGLVKRGDCWHIDKKVRVLGLCESDLGKAEEYLARKIEEIRQASVYGVRPVRTFRMAATKFLKEISGIKKAVTNYC
ncbi:MAG: hypothetical protein Q8N96_11450 [Methylovulum sp.]|nr:hypothetical protein [Methylovulum sp.]